MASFLKSKPMGICLLVLYSLYSLQLHAAASAPYQYAPLTSGETANINNYRENNFKISEIDARDLDPDHISATLFRVSSINSANSQSKLPFMRSPEAVAKLQKLLAKGVTILITPFYEQYEAMVLFPKTEPHNMMLQRLHLPKKNSNPMLFLTVYASESAIVHELVHVDQAYSNYWGALDIVATKIFSAHDVQWENKTPEHNDLLSTAMGLMREVPAYDKQIDYLKRKLKASGKSRTNFDLELAGIDLQFLRLNDYLEAEKDIEFKNCICELLSTQEGKFRNFLFMETMKTCSTKQK